MKIAVNRIAGLLQSIVEVQQNTGRSIGADFFKGLPFKIDYDLSKNIKTLNGKLTDTANEFQVYGASKGVKFTQIEEGGNILMKRELPLDATPEFITEFQSLENKTWNEEVELDVKTFQATEFSDVIFKDCPNKNIFFEYLITD